MRDLISELRQLDEEKSLLLSNPMFDNADCFQELDLSQKGHINTRDIYDFLTDFFECVRFKMAERISQQVPKNQEGKIDP